jgi:hypothetical protein
MPYILRICKKRKIKSKDVLLPSCRRQRGEATYVQLILDLDARWGRVVSVTPRPPFSPGKGPPVPVGKETRGAQTDVEGGWLEWACTNVYFSHRCELKKTCSFNMLPDQEMAVPSWFSHSHRNQSMWDEGRQDSRILQTTAPVSRGSPASSGVVISWWDCSGSTLFAPPGVHREVLSYFTECNNGREESGAVLHPATQTGKMGRIQDFHLEFRNASILGSYRYKLG